MVASPTPRPNRTSANTSNAPRSVGGTSAVKAAKTLHHAMPRAQDAARANPSGEQTRGDLKDGVTNEECTEDPTQMRIVNRILAADMNACDGDIRSVKKCHRAHDK